MRSSRRINLSFVEFGLLSPDSAAGLFFLLFGVFTFVLCCYQHPCQVFSAGTNAVIVVVFVVKPEAFMQLIILQSPKSVLRANRHSNLIIMPPGFRFRPTVLYFWTCPEDSGRESNGKYRVIGPPVVGSDLSDHKRTEHAFASRVPVIGRYQRQLPDDCRRTRTRVCHFLMASDRA